MTEEPQRRLNEDPLLYRSVRTLDMPDLMHGHHNLFVMIIRMGIIKKPEVNGAVITETDIIAMDGTRIGTGIDLRINIEKFQVGKGNKLITADS